MTPKKKTDLYTYRLITILFILLFASCKSTEIPLENTATKTSTRAITIINTLEPSEIPPTQTSTLSPSPTQNSTQTQNPTGTTTSTQAPTPSQTQTVSNYPPEGYGPNNFPININPLTGLKVSDPGILDRRPMAIKVSNGPRSVRPQWGLSFADIIYEYYHEGGSIDGRTRFNAIYYGNDVDQVGPIRSARFVDEHIVRMYNAIFAFASADQKVLNRLYYSDFFNRLATVSDYPCPGTHDYPLCRTDPNGWNHLLANTKMLTEHFNAKNVNNQRQNLDGSHFQEKSPSGGSQSGSITIRYSAKTYNRWDFSPERGQYIRFQDEATDEGQGEQYVLLTDRLTDQPVSADNVVIIIAKHEYYSYSPEMITIHLSGYGKAYVFRDGMMYAANWGRLSDNAPLFIAYDYGSRFPLKPGSTWFQVVGQTTEASQQDNTWRFDFQIP